MTTPDTLGAVLDRATVEEILLLAQRAPSVHNTQPWRWRHRSSTIEVLLDRTRTLAQADPDGRDLELSVGSAVRHLELAARACGWQTETALLPDASRADLAARVSLSPGETPDPDLAALLRRRRTDRRTPGSRPVRRPVLDALGERATPYSVFAITVDTEDEIQRLTSLTRLATKLNGDDEEVVGWTGSKSDSGIPASNLVAHGPASALVSETRFPSGDLVDPGADDPEAGVGWLLLATATDDLDAHLRAGMALTDLLLEAASQGLLAVPYTQPVAVDLTRRRAEYALLPPGLRLQVGLRVGWPDPRHHPLPATRRRPPLLED